MATPHPTEFGRSADDFATEGVRGKVIWPV
jgi:hypothetical protein